MHLREPFDQPAQDKGIADVSLGSVADVVLGLSSPEINAAELHECPGCQYTREAFEKTGRLGCPQCYVAFSEGLGAILKGMHAGIQHAGKVPAHFARSLASNAEAAL